MAVGVAAPPALAVDGTPNVVVSRPRPGPWTASPAWARSGGKETREGGGGGRLGGYETAAELCGALERRADVAAGRARLLQRECRTAVAAIGVRAGASASASLGGGGGWEGRGQQGRDPCQWPGLAHG